jgi:hypothetical protein
VNKEQLKMLAIILTALIGVLFVNNLFLTKKVADRVIETLKREYVPGPYDPGFDPDKVPPKRPTSNFE